MKYTRYFLPHNYVGTILVYRRRLQGIVNYNLRSLLLILSGFPVFFSYSGIGGRTGSSSISTFWNSHSRSRVSIKDAGMRKMYTYTKYVLYIVAASHIIPIHCASFVYSIVESPRVLRLYVFRLFVFVPIFFFALIRRYYDSSLVVVGRRNPSNGSRKHNRKFLVQSLFIWVF